MSQIKISKAEAQRLHDEGKAMQLHGRFNAGLLKAAVFGANDGIVTTFAVVAGVAGAHLSPSVVIILGLANMVADGLSMGLGDFLGERSEQRHRNHQYEVEKWEIENIPDEEEKELDVYFRKQDVIESDRKTLIQIIKKHPKLWTDLGFIDEMGITPQLAGPIWKSSVVTFCAFVAAGFLPLTPYLISLAGFHVPETQQLNYSIIATALTLFFVGSLRTLLTKGTWWKNGLEMLFIGAIAASAAYILGFAVQGIL